ncbi:MAG: DUF58 domain-containing protein, partial [Novosphingobium sp.]|nr:DUF58 domain-containing protein [Novosphingobium sp.]
MSQRATVIPTPRAALLVAAAAPVALLLAVFVPGSWLVAPALGTAVLALVVIDALLAGRAEDVRLTIIPDIEVGEKGWLQLFARFSRGARSTVHCALASDERLLPGGRTEQALFRLEDGDWQVAIGYRPTRRGTGEIEEMWLRWAGPLGLGA